MRRPCSCGVGVGMLCGCFGFEAGQLFLFFLAVHGDDSKNHIVDRAVPLRLPFLNGVFGGGNIVFSHVLAV